MKVSQRRPNVNKKLAAPAHLSKTFSNFRHLAVVACFSCIVFANSLSGGFVWDDEVQVVKNWRIRSLDNLPSAFTSAFWSFMGTQAESQSNFYRPVQTLTYMFAFSIGGLSPASYHALSMGYHTAASMFVYLASVELMLAPPFAFAIAVLFAVHPVHTEAVSWIAGVPDVACGAFYFCSLWLFLRHLRTRNIISLLLACGAFFAALLSKEMAITLPVVLLMLLVMRERSDLATREALLQLSPFLAITGMYLVMRFIALGQLAGVHIDAQAGWLDWSSLGVRVLGEYIRYSVVPYPLNALHLLPLRLEYRALSTSLALVSVLAIGSSLWRLRAKLPEALLWFTIFLVTLIPVLYFKGMSNTFFAERYLYIPSFVMLVLIVGSLSRFAIPRLGLFLGTVALVFAVVTVYRNQAWRTSETLYTSTLKIQPEAVQIRTNLADIHIKRSEDQAARDLLESSLQYMDAARFVYVPADRYRAEVGLGAIAARMRAWDEAKRHLEKAIEINPGGEWGYLYLGGVFMQANGDYAGAIVNFKKAIELGPLNEVARDYMGIAMLNQNDYKDAVAYFQEALKINPNYQDARDHLEVASRALSQ
jgi:tetratricopeptide (TPR) repeat protein